MQISLSYVTDKVTFVSDDPLAKSWSERLPSLNYFLTGKA